MDEGGRDARKVLVLGGGNEEAGIGRRNGAGNGGRDGEEEEENCRSKLARGVRTRSSGGKDRHTKVITAKGLRDRRVRLSVSTAIQFYDVLDRLGYDQPSKAVEWLIKQAQRSIDELQALPPIPSCTAVVRRSEPTWSDKNLGSSFSQPKPLDFIPFSQTRSSDWNLPPHPTHLSIHRSADFHSSLKPPDCSMTVLTEGNHGAKFRLKEISSDPPPPFLGSISSELNPPRFVPPAQNPRHHSGINNSSSNDASSAAAAPSSASFLELLSNESSLENLLHRSANNPHSHSHTHTHSHSHTQLFPPRQQAFFGHTPLASVLIPPLQHAMHGYGGSFASEAPSYPIPPVGFSNLNPNSAPKLQPDPWACLLPSADQQHPKLHSFVLGDSLQSIADPRVHPGSSSFYSFSNPDMNSRGSK